MAKIAAYRVEKFERGSLGPVFRVIGPGGWVATHGGELSACDDAASLNAAYEFGRAHAERSLWSAILSVCGDMSDTARAIAAAHAARVVGDPAVQS